MRKVTFHLMHGGLVVEINEPGQSVSRDEPDASAAGIGDAHQHQIGLDVSGGQAADSLFVQRYAFLRRSFGLIADAPQVAVEAAVNYDFQLRREIFSLSLPAGGRPLPL